MLEILCSSMKGLTELALKKRDRLVVGAKSSALSSCFLLVQTQAIDWSNDPEGYLVYVVTTSTRE